jgi:hypothetical protein
MVRTIGETEDSVEGSAGVLGLLREQAALYAKLERCASRQRPLIAQEDTAPLLSLLAERQRLSMDLAEVNARLEPVRQDWEAIRGRLSYQDRCAVECLLAEIRARLRRLIESDEEDTRLLSARKQATAQGLRATHSMGQALSAYRAPGEPSGRLARVDEAG